MADAWGGSWGSSWGTSWTRETVTPPVVETPTGGGGIYPHTRYRTEKEVRDERIARGIIPPDEPEIQTIVELTNLNNRNAVLIMLGLL